MKTSKAKKLLLPLAILTCLPGCTFVKTEQLKAIEKEVDYDVIVIDEFSYYKSGAYSYFADFADSQTAKKGDGANYNLYSSAKVGDYVYFIYYYDSHSDSSSQSQSFDAAFCRVSVDSGEMELLRDMKGFYPFDRLQLNLFVTYLSDSRVLFPFKDALEVFDPKTKTVVSSIETPYDEETLEKRYVRQQRNGDDFYYLCCENNELYYYAYSDGSYTRHRYSIASGHKYAQVGRIGDEIYIYTSPTYAPSPIYEAKSLVDDSDLGEAKAASLVDMANEAEKEKEEQAKKEEEEAAFHKIGDRFYMDVDDVTPYYGLEEVGTNWSKTYGMNLLKETSKAASALDELYGDSESWCTESYWHGDRLYIIASCDYPGGFYKSASPDFYFDVDPLSGEAKYLGYFAPYRNAPLYFSLLPSE